MANILQNEIREAGRLACARKYFKLKSFELEICRGPGIMAAMDDLLIDRRNGWALLTLNRPAAKNALNTAVLGGLAAHLEALSKDQSCRAVVLAGAEGNFAAGADIGEIETKTSAEGAADPRKGCWATIRAFPKPLIAAVDGFCLGGGFELALMADVIVAGSTARFGLPETNLGLIPGAGGGQRDGPTQAARSARDEDHLAGQRLGLVAGRQQEFGRSQ